MRQPSRVALYMDIRSDYQHGIARGVIRFAKERGHWRLFGHGWTLDEVRRIDSWHGDGIIAIIKNEREARLLLKTGLPIVDVAGAVGHDAIHQITNDDRETGRLAGEHLLDCGLREFAYCGASETYWSTARAEGFLGALRARGCEARIFDRALPWWERPGCPPQLVRFLQGMRRPFGVMGANDTVGVKITAACREASLSVPGDVAVIGVDNEDVLCELSTPSLSSIPCDCEHIGREAAVALDRLITNKRRPRSPRMIPPRPLVARASTDVIACDDDAVKRAVRFVRENAHAAINVADVVRDSGISRRGLEVRFRNGMGRSILDEIQRARVERARRLLRETDLPLTQVATACGFGGYHRLSAVFRLFAGKTPKEFRSAARPS